MDWEKFAFEFTLDPGGSQELLGLLVNIEAYKEASLNLVLPPDWREQLDRLNRARQVHGTTALEGSPLSEAEVLRQMEIFENRPSDPLPSGSAAKLILQIRNAAFAQAWVRNRFDPGAAPVTCGDILEMHRMITQDSDTDHNIPGKWRTFSVTVGSPDMGGIHRGAPHQQLHSLVEEYVRFLESPRLQGMHPVIKALLAHFFLVTIHPFGDGNGRVSRLVEAGILYRQGYNVHGFYGLSNYFYQHETQYKTLLQKCREKQPFDVSQFVRFGIEGFTAELKGINNFIKTKLNRVVYRTMLLRAVNKRVGSYRRLINQREYNLLDFLLSATEPSDPFSASPSRQLTFTELRESPYVKEAYRRVTPRTFHRELDRLSQLGFINFSRDQTGKDWILELNFEAIGRY